MYPHISQSRLEHSISPKRWHKMYKERHCQLGCLQAPLTVLLNFPQGGNAAPMLHVVKEAKAAAAETIGVKPCERLLKRLVHDHSVWVWSIGFLFGPNARLTPSVAQHQTPFPFSNSSLVFLRKCWFLLAPKAASPAGFHFAV